MEHSETECTSKCGPSLKNQCQVLSSQLFSRLRKNTLFLILSIKKLTDLFVSFCEYGNMSVFELNFGNLTYVSHNFGIFVCIYQIQMPIHQFNKVCIQISVLFPHICEHADGLVWIGEVLCIKFWLCLGCCSSLWFSDVQKILGQWFYTKNMHNSAEHPADCIWVLNKLFSLTLYLFSA